MDLKAIIRAEKEVTSLGEWSRGKMSRASFSLSKVGTKGYRLGNRDWCVVRFSALSSQFRVLINFSADLEQYQATLGISAGTDLKVLASFEHHPTHDSWHAHLACDAVSRVPAGMRRGPWVKRLKRGNSRSARKPFEFTKDQALDLAAEFYRFKPPSEDGQLALAL